MLENSADAQVEAFPRRTDPDRLSAHGNDAGVRLLQASENAYEGRFSRAVLAEQDVNLTGENVERHIIVGNDARESFGDAAQCNRGNAAGDCRRRIAS